MALNFQGTDITPKRGANLTGRKTTGVRLSVLKKGQKSITIGNDVLSQLGLTDLGDKGIKVVVREGSGAAWQNKILVQVADNGPFTLRYVSTKKKSAGHVMSSSLPFAVSDKAKYKVYADDKALVIAIPSAPAAGGTPAPADGADADFAE
jgi:hypothetical protein